MLLERWTSCWTCFNTFSPPSENPQCNTARLGPVPGSFLVPYVREGQSKRVKRRRRRMAGNAAGVFVCCGRRLRLFLSMLGLAVHRRTLLLLCDCFCNDLQEPVHYVHEVHIHMNMIYVCVPSKCVGPSFGCPRSFRTSSQAERDAPQHVVSR